MKSNLRAVFTRAQFSVSELDVLRGIIRSLDGFMRKDGKMRTVGNESGDKSDNE